ncbi:MAG TPA: BPSS1780 family membrane protein [Nitrosomonas sp.]|nr:BPSS1780 family membrane protein [Nitrosomonas sp.]HMW19489.1 BPSS1780 family membrane protein [Nitrosomonas sp.]HMW68757.1 BPSS1780 family membrane protein [Nitrosomonas sp.]HMY61471.1 BPSS1780 family membrane protein [Nitrosomonas sp.]HMY90616.1 BPSS1780 family membrane protein [Nitrosomonas sp.]
MEARHVRGRQGLQWILSGFYYFKLSPFVWMLLSSTFLMVELTLQILPVLGIFAFLLISPVLVAGVMVGCQSLDQGQRLQLEHLFVGFRKNTAPLITVGGFNLIALVLIVGIFMLMGGDALIDMLVYGKRFGENELMGIMDNVLSAWLAALGLSIPLMMAIWFAPLLIIFENLPPAIAIRKSFFACLNNMAPFFVYGITLLILFFLISTVTVKLLSLFGAVPPPLILIILYIVILPTIFASIYASYQDIFPSEPPSEETNQNDEDTSSNSEANH